jgi:dipeptidyl aminopeptidase/acylaminoacyl peptidase
MKRFAFVASFLLLFIPSVFAQQKMTPELLWQLGRVSGETLTSGSQNLLYSVGRYDIQTDKTHHALYSIPVMGGKAIKVNDSIGSNFQVLPGGEIGYQYKGQWWEMNANGSDNRQITHTKQPMDNIRLSPSGDYILFTREVKVKNVLGSDYYPQFNKSDVKIYNNLNFRHWDKWSNGYYSHVMYATFDSAGNVGVPVDIMQYEPYDCPQEPFGGIEDLMWSPDEKYIVYVCKKEYGKAYATSTNTDIYFYNLNNGITTDFTAGMKGYDMLPAFSPDGKRLAWTSMKTDGYESDKNDIVVADVDKKIKLNLTSAWDGTVSNFRWSNDGKYIYFIAAVQGTMQLFSVEVPNNLMTRRLPVVHQVTNGIFDVNNIIGQQDSTLVVMRTDMNHAAEAYRVNVNNGSMQQLTKVNNNIYDSLELSKIEKRWIKTTDGKRELTWIIYPPGFDSAKKYPTLLYCQGGPEDPLTQFYSFRWNFQLMAANGYIVVAPDRRGMPGFGVKWNEAIVKDFGDQPMKDYLSAIDSMAKLPFVDNSRLGCVGASYGGYSVYMLAGMNNHLFKTFIAHDGMFDTRSWYGTTDEMWFADRDMGMPYGKDKYLKSYEQYNPINYVDKWDAPILIIQGGEDYRVPVEQGLEAFKAAQMLGIKSKLLYFPKENHWVLDGHDALIWQHEFFNWLKNTL